MVLDHSKILWRSSCGTPSRSAIAWSGSSEATAVTKSSALFSAASVTILRARSASSSRIPATPRGVKPREMIRRCFLWISPSSLTSISRWASMIERSVPSANRGIMVFSPAENVSPVTREISLTSACLVTSQ